MARADRLFFQLACHQPLLILVEDLHWSDEASLEFLLYFARRLLTQPILLLMTYRHEEVGRELKRILALFDRERLTHEEVLTPLTMNEVEAFIQAIFELKGPVPAVFLETLYQLTEGNPFFLEEILKSLTAPVNLFLKDNASPHKPLALEELNNIPRSVQLAVQRRTDQLSQEARHLLVLAAVNGRRFDFNLLQALTGKDEPTLLDCIKELVQAQLVVEETADRYAFRHALTQQAVYTDLLGRERRALHRQIAEKLEELYGSAGDSIPGELVYHYYKGEGWSKVVEYGQSAGDRALAMYSPRAAIAYYSWAIQALERLGQPASSHLYEVRGRAHEMVSEFEAAHQDYNSELEAAYRLEDQVKQWQSLLNLGALWRGRDYERSKGYLESATALAREIGNPALLARSLNLIGNWVLNSDQPLEARRFHQEALNIFQKLNDKNGLADTFDFLGVAGLISGNLVEANEHYRQALTLFRELDQRHRLVSSLTMASLRGPNYLSLMLVPATHNSTEPLLDAQEALRLSHQIGDSSGEAFAQSIMVACLGMQGRYPTALELAGKSLALATQLEHPQWITFANWAEGVIRLDLLQLAPARQYLEQALNQAQQMGVLFLIHVMQGFLASALIAQGELSQAEKLLQSAPGPDTQQPPLLSRNSGWLLPLSLLVKAHIELALARKNPVRALSIIEKWKSELPNLEAGTVVPALWHYHGLALMAMGRLEEAEPILMAALVAAQAHQAHCLQWRIQLSLGKLYQSQGRTAQSETSLAQGWSWIEELAKPMTEEGLGERFLANARKLFPNVVPLTPRKASKRAFGGLTERERTIASRLAQGQSNRQIAQELTLSERTVDKHVENIKVKLGFNSRTQIALWAAQKGLVNSSKI